MSLKCGIVGLPNVGKSTLFNAISNNKAAVANFPFCTIKPNIGITTVADDRLKVLEGLVNAARVLPATIEFVDIAGLVKGASKGEGLGNQFLANIREVDAIVHVIRCFDDDNIVHVDGRIDPVADKEIIDTELQLRDLETITKRIGKVEKLAKTGDSRAKKEYDTLNKYQEYLEQGNNARRVAFAEEDKEVVADLHLLTGKPVIYVANVGEDSINTSNEYVEVLRTAIVGEGAQMMVISASIESQIAELEEDQERQMFLQEYHLSESGLVRLINASRDLLELITYFTAGPKEVRAWTIKKGWKAPKAAGVIHSDFEKGFITAEVIKFTDYERYKSEQSCKEVGKMSVEGREYVVADGDVIHFRWNL